MTERIEKLYNILKSKDYKTQRRSVKKPESNTTTVEGQIQYMKALIGNEVPIIFEGDTMGFNRSTDYVVKEDWGNLIPNYGRVITDGFENIKRQIGDRLTDANDEQKVFGNAMITQLDMVSEFAEKYRVFAKDKSPKLSKALENIPKKGASSFYEACVFIKICIFVLRLSGTQHVTLGRFDQYMYPFFEADIERGVSESELFETLEEFFITINYDSDLYPGIQSGDNGQSLVLGGYDSDGNDMYNLLSKMCIDASSALCLIDPKINLRVNKTTPHERYVFGTTLTKKGLGFPQYCNDDVVVPGLLKLGYDLEDAVNYGVAACWEYIVSNVGADIPNLKVMDFPYVVGESIKKHLEDSDTFEELMKNVENDIDLECQNIINVRKIENTNVYNVFASVLIDTCIERLKNLYFGGSKYSNFGCHGTGISIGADSLAAIKKLVYDEKSVSKKEVLEALENDFKGYEKIQKQMLACPKMGENNDYVDDIAASLMMCFGNSLNNKPNNYGGIWRAGTGSAMEYIRKGEKCPATTDGRNAYTPYASSFSPSLTSNVNGLLSVISSFTKYDMTEIINGGPLTIEIHDTVLKNDIGIEKTAILVEEFIKRGGHQLQLNSINREVLLDAQKHPENYPNLIVRVWGWSGYFNELDIKYQNHIIKRTEFII